MLLNVIGALVIVGHNTQKISHVVVSLMQFLFPFPPPPPSFIFLFDFKKMSERGFFLKHFFHIVLYSTLFVVKALKFISFSPVFIYSYTYRSRSFETLPGTKLGMIDENPRTDTGYQPLFGV